MTDDDFCGVNGHQYTDSADCVVCGEPMGDLCRERGHIYVGGHPACVTCGHVWDDPLPLPPDLEVTAWDDAADEKRKRARRIDKLETLAVIVALFLLTCALIFGIFIARTYHPYH